MCCCPVCVYVCEGPADSNTAGIGTSRPLTMSISLSVVCSAQKKAFVASALPVLYLHTEGAREREGEEIGGEPWLLYAWGAQHRDQPRCSHNAPAVTFGCMHPFKGDPFFLSLYLFHPHCLLLRINIVFIFTGDLMKLHSGFLPSDAQATLTHCYSG